MSASTDTSSRNTTASTTKQLGQNIASNIAAHLKTDLRQVPDHTDPDHKARPQTPSKSPDAMSAQTGTATCVRTPTGLGCAAHA